MSEAVRTAPPGRWSFLSNHAHVLLCVARDPRVRLREVSESIGITQRGVLRILRDLEEAGLLERHREGRRNAYALRLDQPLRHRLAAGCRVGEFVELLLQRGTSDTSSDSTRNPTPRERIPERQ